MPYKRRKLYGRHFGKMVPMKIANRSRTRESSIRIPQDLRSLFKVLAPVYWDQSLNSYMTWAMELGGASFAASVVDSLWSSFMLDLMHWGRLFPSLGILERIRIIERAQRYRRQLSKNWNWEELFVAPMMGEVHVLH